MIKFRKYLKYLLCVLLTDVNINSDLIINQIKVNLNKLRKRFMTIITCENLIASIFYAFIYTNR